MRRLLLDMGLPRRATTDLRAEGWDVIHVGTEGMSRHSDESIVEVARGQDQHIITLDEDFARIVATSGHGRPSVVLIRVQGLDRVRATALIKQVVSAIGTDLDSGCIASVTPNGVRIRQLPIR
jgi:predicted nuclease of predicted toxin-antitoxin system